MVKSMQTIEKHDKPREKLLARGAQSLRDYELLAVLLGSGTQGKDVLSLSREALRLFESDFEGLSLEKLTAIHGTLNQSLVHPREVFADAICDRAASIIVAHNHPSGQLIPSDADKRITRRLKEVADIVGIELLDHVILSKEGYYSFDEEGML